MCIACLKNEIESMCIEMGDDTVFVRTCNLWPKVNEHPKVTQRAGRDVKSSS
jgi:hypothetical protein